MARIGKISRLPETIRTQLNQRLQDGQQGQHILPWLNALPEVRAILEANFGNKDINAQNLSDWRMGGFQDWLKHRDRFYHTRLLAERSVELAKAAGGNLTEGASAILAGQVLEALESIGDFRELLATSKDGDVSEADRQAKMALVAESLDSLSNAVSKLRKGDQNNIRLQQVERDLARKDAELRMMREQHEIKCCDLFLKWLADKRALEIANAPLSNADKIAALRQTYFADIDALEKSGEIVLPD